MKKLQKEELEKTKSEIMQSIIKEFEFYQQKANIKTNPATKKLKRIEDSELNQNTDDRTHGILAKPTKELGEQTVDMMIGNLPGNQPTNALNNPRKFVPRDKEEKDGPVMEITTNWSQQSSVPQGKQLNPKPDYDQLVEPENFILKNLGLDDTNINMNDLEPQGFPQVDRTQTQQNHIDDPEDVHMSQGSVGIIANPVKHVPDNLESIIKNSVDEAFSAINARR